MTGCTFLCSSMGHDLFCPNRPRGPDDTTPPPAAEDTIPPPLVPLAVDDCLDDDEPERAWPAIGGGA